MPVDITRLLGDAVPAGVVLDRELIIWEHERTSFAVLHQRITAGAHATIMEHPANQVVFDLLRDAAGLDLLDAPLAERRTRPSAFLAGAPTQLPLCPQTTDLNQATEWLTGWTAAGIEGVVAKRLDGRYRPGRRAWVKCRARSTTEAIVGGVTGTVAAPGALLLGRYDVLGRLRYVGRTQPLSAHQCRLLIGLLVPCGPREGRDADHPWRSLYQPAGPVSGTGPNRSPTHRCAPRSWLRSRSTPPSSTTGGATRSATGAFASTLPSETCPG